MRKYLVFAFATAMLFALTSAPASAFDLGFKLGLASGLEDFGDAADDSVAWGVYLENNFLSSRVSWQARFERHVHEMSDGFQRYGDAVAPDGDYTGEFTVNRFIIDLKYDLPINKKWDWIVFGGVGAYNWDADLTGEGTDLTNETRGTETTTETTTTCGNCGDSTQGTTVTSTTQTVTSDQRRGDSGTDLGFNIGTGFEYMLNPDTGVGLVFDYHNGLTGDFDDSFWSVMASLFFSL